MIVALDVGSSEFRSLRYEGNRLIARRIPAVYCVLDDTSGHREWLKAARLPWSRCRGALLVTGEAAQELAQTLERPLVPLLPGGDLPDKDPVGRQVCASLIESLIPNPVRHSAVCAVSTPPQPRPFLEHVLELHGYRIVRLHPATALVLADSDRDEFTAAAVTMGAEQTTFTICHLGRPLVELAFPFGSRAIEDGFARHWNRFLWDSRGHRYLDFQSIQRWLSGRPDAQVDGDEQSGPVSLAVPRSPEAKWLADAFTRHWARFWKEVEEEVASIAPVLPRHPVPLIVSGGPVQLPGFLELVSSTRRKVAGESPFRISELRRTSHAPYSVARGLLIHATLWNDETQAATFEAA